MGAGRVHTGLRHTFTAPLRERANRETCHITSLQIAVTVTMAIWRHNAILHQCVHVSTSRTTNSSLGTWCVRTHSTKSLQSPVMQTDACSYSAHQRKRRLLGRLECQDKPKHLVKHAVKHTNTHNVSLSLAALALIFSSLHQTWWWWFFYFFFICTHTL